MITTLLDNEIAAYNAFGHPALMQRFIKSKGSVQPVLAHLPKSIKRGLPRNCFQNAYNLAMMGFRYVEGYGVTPAIPLLIHHAWVLDEQGYVIDNTWENSPSCMYVGVELPLDTLLAETFKSGCYGVLDTGMGINATFILQQAPELVDILENCKVQKLISAPCA